MTPTQIGLNMEVCESCYLFYSLWLLSRSGSFIQTQPFQTQSIQSLTTINTVYILGPTHIGLNVGGCVSLDIYFTFSGCWLGPKDSYQHDHLKLRASKPHNNSKSVYFGSDLDRVKYGGLCESCYLFHSL